MKPELLAPAGGWEQLEYAIRFGADAVYLATESFGMRSKAINFNIEEMPQVVDYAHKRGAKVHVACNIVMRDGDLEQLPAYFEALEAAGADATIIGDLGALRIARKHAPSLDIHVSTQASVANSESALAWYEMGAKRIVLARELSLDAIANIRARVPREIELEAFCHGSMCMAYSGRCIISDYLADRSAQRGACAQSCRWNYALVEEKRPGEYITIEEDSNGTYILNSKDMNMLAHLADMEEAGIDSIKIEGRNKKAFYVAIVTNAYRQVLDGANPADFAHELETVSHRPYSTGFFYGPATQSFDSVDYVRSYQWMADVLECESMGNGIWLATIRCRNKFDATDKLEVVSPMVPSASFRAWDFMHVPIDAEEASAPYSVAEISRTMETYTMLVDRELKPFDIIRAPSRG